MCRKEYCSESETLEGSVNIDQLASALRHDEEFMNNVTAWKTIPPREGQMVDFPASMDRRMAEVLKKRGINRLYTHQASAWEAAVQQKDYVVVTPTASGKTLCYNLPVLSAILKDQDSRALYLFPTKALALDQAGSLYELIEAMDVDVKAYTYDGDTQAAARKAIRQAGHIVVTNPDMLHANILPHHTKWVKLFENLRYIVIDEIHTYRGVFGSHLANVLRRLLRLCAFYGNAPRFILCSATIANPAELGEILTGRPIEKIDNNGAPMGKKHFVFYNPPVVNRQLGIRRGAVNETRAIAETLLKNDISTIVFAKSRVQVEVLTRTLKDMGKDRNAVRGYRGGYLPSERQSIQRQLRAGQVKLVISTNALELGVDIGSLTACVLCGYPGTIASTWQQAGRAGRRNETALTIMVASSAPIDQYIVAHPEYFLTQSPEHALLHPDNLYILLSHIKCAAFELPFQDGEAFGNVEGTAQFLEFLTEGGILRHVGSRYHWSAEEFPASEINLRSATAENFVIIDISDAAHHRVIGEMDRYTVPMLLHENAIYLHGGSQYQVETLDFDACKAYIRAVDVDYYTDADMNVSIGVLDEMKEKTLDGGATLTLGELKVTTIVKIFKKMKLDTHENLGHGEVRLPESTMHTVGMWWTIPEAVSTRYGNDELQNAMMGIANLLAIVAPIYLMCAPRDIKIVYQVKAPHTDMPTIFLYDQYPGGIGLSEKAYEMQEMLLQHALDIVESCGCEGGCPSCVGPLNDTGLRGKSAAKRILRELLNHVQPEG